MRPASLPSRSFLVAALAAVFLVGACASSEARLPAKSEKRAAVINLIRQEARNMGVSVPLALAVAHAEPISIRVPKVMSERVVSCKSCPPPHAWSMVFTLIFFGTHG